MRDACFSGYALRITHHGKFVNGRARCYNLPHHASLAQMAEQLIRNEQV